MNKHLKDLVELSRVDKAIDSYEPKIESINAELNEELRQKQDIINKIEELDDEIKGTKLKIQKNELHLEELNDKIKDISKKSGTLKTEKEIKAIQLEEELAKEQINFSNEEIERYHKLIESYEEKKVALKDELTNIDEQVKTIEEANKKEISAIEKDKEKVFKEKESLLSSMDQKIISFYQKIRRWAGESTVVPLYNHACGGCYLRINDKTHIEILKGEEIITCPHCGRVVFYEPEASEDTTESK